MNTSHDSVAGGGPPHIRGRRPTFGATISESAQARWKRTGDEGEGGTHSSGIGDARDASTRVCDPAANLLRQSLEDGSSPELSLLRVARGSEARRFNQDPPAISRETLPAPKRPMTPPASPPRKHSRPSGSPPKKKFAPRRTSGSGAAQPITGDHRRPALTGRRARSRSRESRGSGRRRSRRSAGRGSAR